MQAVVSKETRRISFAEQRQNVVQLSRDRKNGVGGYSAGLKNFAEMGPPSGAHWPFSAEQIRRSFGVPGKRNDPESDYILTIRARCHGLLEEKARELEPHVPELFRSWDSIFDVDSGGDRDFDWYREKASGGLVKARELRDQADALRELSREHRREGRLKEAREEERKAGAASRESNQTMQRARGHRDVVFQCESFLNLLTHALEDDELVVEFSQRMSRLEEEAQDRENQRIWNEYVDLKSKKPIEEAKRLICNEHGISRATLGRIEQSKRMEAGLPPRGRGRPKKEEAS